MVLEIYNYKSTKKKYYSFLPGENLFIISELHQKQSRTKTKLNTSKKQ